MPWFYANAGQQVGPISDADFERLTREGVIQPATLVWREGMAQWEPLANVRVASPPALPVDAPIAAPGQVLCAECRRLVPATDTMQVGNATICAACKPIYVQKLREGAVTFTPQVTALRYAGFWIRFGAKFIDGLIMMIVTLPLSFIFPVQFVFNPGSMPDIGKMLAQQGIVASLNMVIAMLYTWLLVGRYSATPGKMLLGIRIVTREGQRVTYLRAFARYWAELVSQLTCYVGYIIAGFDDEKRALHDHMCNTRVVYK